MLRFKKMKIGDTVQVKSKKDLNNIFIDITDEGPYFTKEMENTLEKNGKIIEIISKKLIRVKFKDGNSWVYLLKWLNLYKLDNNNNFLLEFE
jgi:hypothetical protein